MWAAARALALGALAVAKGLSLGLEGRPVLGVLRSAAFSPRDAAARENRALLVSNPRS